MAAARSGIFSFPPWMVAFFVRASTGHIGIFSLVMAITSDKGGHLYENHHAHRCCHKVKKEPISSSSCNSFWLGWGKGVCIVTGPAPVMTSTVLTTVAVVHIGPHWSTVVHIGPHWFTLVHIGPRWSTLVHVGPHWSKVWLGSGIPRRTRGEMALITTGPTQPPIGGQLRGPGDHR